MSVNRKPKAPGNDDDSYYDEENDSMDNDKIGKGFDSDDSLDLTEFTEDDVKEKKLELLQEKLEEDYNKGLPAQKDPSTLIEMKTIRLTFLNVGPTIQNLEFFENLQNLFLQYN